MAILLWLLPPVVVTAVAIAWVSWIGRDRPALHDRSEAAQERAQQRFASRRSSRHGVRRHGSRAPASRCGATGSVDRSRPER
jgi:hypothetical protein